ncbi:apoptotic chromatin condensation inducer in the nucleus-like isoform X2 [Cylas formicarius]|uniref:apoptotic chromatin condensation inducer in the nucleus-like isoform X2 n=1 Tax=Cylas formicarius TaxID=197179 RepID=UPI002958D103|nr:apoptotic chromatin condensation inducer in the nucleus-like isoform X2 [Cylas formicarius]
MNHLVPLIEIHCEGLEELHQEKTMTRLKNVYTVDLWYQRNIKKPVRGKILKVTSQSPSNTQTVFKSISDKAKCEEECTKSASDSSENKCFNKVSENQELKASIAVTVLSNENNPETSKLEEYTVLKEDMLHSQQTEDNIQLGPLQPSSNNLISNSGTSNLIETNSAKHNQSSDKIVSSFSDSKENLLLKVVTHSLECPKVETFDKQKLLTTSSDQLEANQESTKKSTEPIETKKILLKRAIDGKASEIFNKEEVKSSCVEVNSDTHIEEQSQHLTKKCLESCKSVDSQNSENADILSSEESLKKKITLKRLPDTKTLGNLLQDVSDSKHEEQSIDEDSEQTKKSDLQKKEKADTSEKHKDMTNKNQNRKILLKRRSTVEAEKPSLIVDNKKKEDKMKLEQTSFQESSEKEQSSSGDDATNEDRKRKYSNAFEMGLCEHQEADKKPGKLPKVIKIVRNLLTQQGHSFEGKENPETQIILKKPKWNSTNITSTKIICLNLKDLRRMCPKLGFAKEDEVNLDLTFKEKQQLEIEKRKEMVEAKREEKEKMLMEHIEKEISEVEVKENVITLNRKISIVDDTASKMKPPPTPPKNPISNVIFVTNLVRPFTVKQLKELLERTGRITEDGFWTDKIKSKCYVKYDTPEEAEATRNALHGVNWPIGNGKKLIIEYSTEEELEKVKNPPQPFVRREKTPEKENQLPGTLVVRERMEENAAVIAPVLTWDMGKEDNHQKRPRMRSRSKEKVGRLSQLPYMPEDFYQKRTKYEEVVAPKAMDDLFLKTKVTPSIYWQPLSPEEIVLKQQQRQMRMEEHKRRLEESGRGRGGARDLPRERERNFRRR